MRILLVLGLFVVSGCLQEIVPLPPSPSTDAGDSGNGNGVGGNGTAGIGGPGGPTGNGSAVADMSTGSSVAHDAGTSGDVGSGASACIAPATSTINGNHNQGTACLGCHNGTTAPQFYAAGTIYDGTGKGAAGVTVQINDGKNTVSVVTASSPPGTEGNFFIATPIGATLKVRASSCPADKTMPGNAGGDCNSCHGASMQIHIP